MNTTMYSFVEAKEQIKPMKFRTLKEYSEWVKTNNFEELFPVNPRLSYSDFKGGADFLGYTEKQYKELIKQVRKEKVDYVAVGKKISALHAEKKRNSVKPAPPVQPSTETSYLSAEEMVKFFIREDVDMKVIVNFLSEFSHPKDVYQIFLDYLKSKYVVKI